MNKQVTKQMVNIEINGKKLQVPQGSMVIEAADSAGMTIPRFCYHHKLSVAANCRMCLVDIEKMPKPVPACATPVTDGMKILTHSAKALDAQKSVMEFLLINHPLDCPICDQGGECKLQDLSMGFGSDRGRYQEFKRVLRDKDIGPLIATEMTRCIHCTRCVRFGQEIAGVMELGATGRGEHMRIGTYVERAVNSEMSGNVIDLCPVGALTSKPYHYHGRAWENTAIDGVASHDCIGSNIHIEVRRNKVMRVLPRENESLNECWLSDRDRFSYSALDSDERLTQPMIKQGDDWKVVDWPTALNYAVDGLKAVIKKYDVRHLGALVSPSSTLEEMYLLQKLMRGLGCDNIEHRLRQQDFSHDAATGAYPLLGLPVAELENLDAALLIGSCVRKDQPIAAHRLRKAAVRGANIMAINALDYDFNFPLAESLVVSPTQMLHSLAAICKVLLETSKVETPTGLSALLTVAEVNDTHRAMANHLQKAEKAAVLIGTQAMSQNELSGIRALAGFIAESTGASLGYLSEGANALGAWLAGALPHQGPAAVPVDNDQTAVLDKHLMACVLLNVEPELDCANASAAHDVVRHAEFVISMASYVSENMKASADVLLPIAAFAETSGTFVNGNGDWQSFNGSCKPAAEARPAWKVLRVLGNLFELEGFDYLSSEEVRDELKIRCEGIKLSAFTPWRCPSLQADDIGLQRIGHLPMYAVDMLVRRARPLQDTSDAIAAAIYINEDTASRAGVADGEHVQAVQGSCSVSLPLVIDESIPDGCVMIPVALKETAALGAAYGAIELRK
ncbi:NADH-ubiquinone oxidoreductase chain G [hydrothermal vent metagenome]|uniref:NADH-ubiquinone oxidoreductase chain G n=1 Tax=hydrothermal vent metagenome TaxID=652676 RepID=A0A3B1BCW8_9ZZZZ